MGGGVLRDLLRPRSPPCPDFRSEITFASRACARSRVGVSRQKHRRPFFGRKVAGLSTSEALRLYVDAAPVKATAAPDRLPIRDHRYPPGAWRRAVALPAACQGPNAADRQRDFEARVRALPSPEWLAHWYRRIRADWWRRYSVHAFLRDAAERRIPVYGSHVSGLGGGADRFGDLHPVP